MYTMIRSFLTMKINDKRSRESILRLQEKKFRKMLKFAYNNSKFYHDFYSSKNISEKDLETIDIKKIPSVDKELLMENLDDVLTVDDVSKKELLEFLNISKNPNQLFKDKYHVIHTSGTTGKVGIFVYSKKDWDSFYPYITKLFDFNFTRSKTAYVGCIGGHFAALSFTSWLDTGIPKIFCNLYIIDINKPIKEIVSQLNEIQPDVLGGFFNELKIIAQQQDMGLLKINPKVIVNCGEAVIPKDKQYIEKVFNAPLNNLYGFAECLIAGAGKNEYDGIYLQDDIALIEIYEDYILLTNLFNKTLPIIRYRIDDFVKLKKNPSKKAPFTVVENVIGRAEDVIWFENNEGNLDSLHPFLFVVLYIKGLQKFRIVIKDRNSFDFLAVISKSDKKQVIAKIKEELDKILMKKNFTNVTYNIKIVDDIPIDKKSGKYKLIVSQIVD